MLKRPREITEAALALGYTDIRFIKPGKHTKLIAKRPDGRNIKLSISGTPVCSEDLGKVKADLQRMLSWF